MDLPRIEHVLRPLDRAQIPPHSNGDAFLAGGTWLFSEPQPDLRRLVDLTALDWPPVERDASGLRIAATCPMATLEAHETPPAWIAAHLIGRCVQALLGSFKIRRQATVGGNLCLALPASPMAALAVALDATCLVWSADGEQRSMPASHFILGASRTALRTGELLREIVLPEAALCRRAAFRQFSLTPLGRSAALLIGTRVGPGVTLTITASVAVPVQVVLAGMPDPDALHAAIDVAVPVWHDDVHGRPSWRRRVTHLMAEEIVAELAA